MKGIERSIQHQAWHAQTNVLTNVTWLRIKQCVILGVSGLPEFLDNAWNLFGIFGKYTLAFAIPTWVPKSDGPMVLEAPGQSGQWAQRNSGSLVMQHMFDSAAAAGVKKCRTCLTPAESTHVHHI